MITRFVQQAIFILLIGNFIPYWGCVKQI